ncbi:hypothetical protein [Pelagerythrobacter sp.]|uniref:head-tail connector protein n=1 Tax=Pelagerythrobacter sp. TaxID=2800702 RepID=UPI0035B122F1
MRRTILSPPDLLGALVDLKHWLAISSAAEDAALTGLLAAALDACEAFTGAMPLVAECEEIHPAHRDWQSLAARPVQAIAGVEGIPAEGPRFALAPDAYAIDLGADGSGRVRVIRQGAAGRIAVRFTAGLAADWSALPESLRHGTVRLAAELHRARDGAPLPHPPAAVAALWQPWRRMRLA